MPLTPQEEAASHCNELLSALTRITMLVSEHETKRERAIRLLREWEQEAAGTVDRDESDDAAEMMRDVFALVRVYLEAQRK